MVRTSSNPDDCTYSRKRMRIEEPTSICKAESPLPLSREEEGENETVEEIEDKLKEAEEEIVQVKKEAKRASAQVKKLREHDMVCMVCREVIQNPQILHCGHSACYPCLRKWWMKPPAEHDGAAMADTEAESDFDEANVAANELNPAGPDPSPHLRRRHRFSSAVNREKRCPYCNTLMNHRPIPGIRLHDTLETMDRPLTSLPSHIQARGDARRTDIWHGIFHPVNESYRDPIPAHVIAAEEAIAARERNRGQAFAEGWAVGALEIRTERERMRRGEEQR